MRISELTKKIMNAIRSKLSTKDLYNLCTCNDLSSSGSKRNLQDRLESFLPKLSYNQLLVVSNKIDEYLDPSRRASSSAEVVKDRSKHEGSSLNFKADTLSDSLLNNAPIDLWEEVTKINRNAMVVVHFTRYSDCLTSVPSQPGSGANSRASLIRIPNMLSFNVLQSSPFYTCAVCLHPLSLLVPVTMPNVNQNDRIISDAVIKFILSDDSLKLIMRHCKTPDANGRSEYKWQVLLRFAVLDPTLGRPENGQVVPQMIPPYLTLAVNDRQTPLWEILPSNCRSKEGKRHAKPVNITDKLNIDNRSSEGYRQTISLRWWQTPGVFQYYYVGVYLERKLSVRELFDLLSSNRHVNVRPIEFTLNLIKSKLNDSKYRGNNNDDDDDLVVSSVLPISLSCPIGRSRIQLPVRSINCQHLQCFDALLFLSMNDRRSIWKCPVCETSATPSELFCDKYFQRILNEYRDNDNVNDINVNKDGSYVPVYTRSKKDHERNEKEKEATMAALSTSVMDTMIVLDSDDDDEEQNTRTSTSSASSSSVSRDKTKSSRSHSSRSHSSKHSSRSKNNHEKSLSESNHSSSATNKSSSEKTKKSSSAKSVQIQINYPTTSSIDKPTERTTVTLSSASMNNVISSQNNIRVIASTCEPIPCISSSSTVTTSFVVPSQLFAQSKLVSRAANPVIQAPTTFTIPGQSPISFSTSMYTYMPTLHPSIIPAPTSIVVPVSNQIFGDMSLNLSHNQSHLEVSAEEPIMSSIKALIHAPTHTSVQTPAQEPIQVRMQGPNYISNKTSFQTTSNGSIQVRIQAPIYTSFQGILQAPIQCLTQSPNAAPVTSSIQTAIQNPITSSTLASIPALVQSLVQSSVQNPIFVPKPTSNHSSIQTHNPISTSELIQSPTPAHRQTLNVSSIHTLIESPIQSLKAVSTQSQIQTPKPSPLQTSIQSQIQAPQFISTPTPIQTPKPSPIGTPIQTPKPSPIGTPIQTPKPSPIGTPIQSAIQSQIQANKSTPTPASIQTPKPSLIGTPIQTAIQSSIGTPIQSAIQAHKSTPTSAPIQTPKPSPIGTPIQTAIQSSIQSQIQASKPVAAVVPSTSVVTVQTSMDAINHMITSPVKASIEPPTQSSIQSPVIRPIRAPIFTQIKNTIGASNVELSKTQIVELHKVSIPETIPVFHPTTNLPPKQTSITATIRASMEASSQPSVSAQTEQLASQTESMTKDKFTTKDSIPVTSSSSSDVTTVSKPSKPNILEVFRTLDDVVRTLDTDIVSPPDLSFMTKNLIAMPICCPVVIIDKKELDNSSVVAEKTLVTSSNSQSTNSSEEMVEVTISEASEIQSPHNEESTKVVFQTSENHNNCSKDTTELMESAVSQSSENIPKSEESIRTLITKAPSLSSIVAIDLTNDEDSTPAQSLHTTTITNSNTIHTNKSSLNGGNIKWCSAQDPVFRRTYLNVIPPNNYPRAHPNNGNNNSRVTIPPKRSVDNRHTPYDRTPIHDGTNSAKRQRLFNSDKYFINNKDHFYNGSHGSSMNAL